MVRATARAVERGYGVVLGDRYITDFFAVSVGLVVEVDGTAHRVRGG